MLETGAPGRTTVTTSAVAGGSQQHEGVPQRVLEAQAPPEMEDHANRVENAAEDRRSAQRRSSVTMESKAIRPLQPSAR